MYDFDKLWFSVAKLFMLSKKNEFILQKIIIQYIIF